MPQFMMKPAVVLVSDCFPFGGDRKFIITVSDKKKKAGVIGKCGATWGGNVAESFWIVSAKGSAV
jgi:hypothetical protein